MIRSLSRCGRNASTRSGSAVTMTSSRLRQSRPIATSRPFPFRNAPAIAPPYGAAARSLLLKVICGLMLLHSCGSLEARMAEKVLIDSDTAANDDGLLVTPERTARVAAYIDDPCDEGGYDAFCRDRHGTLCQKAS